LPPRTSCARAVAWLAASVLCGTPLPARAQAAVQGAGDASIFALDAAADGSVIGAGVALAFLPYALGDSLVTPSCPCDPSAINALDRGAVGNASQLAATLSDVTSIAAVAAPIGADFAALGASRAFFEDAVVFGQTVLVSNALANVTKLIVQRPRPETYASRDRALLRATGSYLSFYSGHTTMTFAALSAGSMILHLRHGVTVWPWIVTALVGTSVGVERVLAGKHFPTDVLAGAATGVAEGVLIPYLHRRRAAAPAYGVTLLPIASGALLVFGWRG
jgi:membrane-associated phospholipid phosphatase